MQMVSRIPNWTCYIPFAYVTTARLGTLAKSLSLVLLYVMPTLYFALLSANFSLDILPTYLIGLVMIYTLYEMGYIQNDTEAIKREIKPSLRLWDRNFDFYNRHKLSIYTTRVTIVLILSTLLLLLHGTTTSTILFLISVWSITLIYQVYNSGRNRWGLFLFVLLQISRYMPYMLLFYPNISPKICLLLFCSFPLCNIMERSSHPRFGIRFSQLIIPNDQFLTTFRVLYYLLACITLLFLYFLNIISLIDCPVYICFLLYRIAILILIKSKYRPKNYLVR